MTTTKAMPLLMNRAGQHLELRNSADEVLLPSMELKTGEETRAAARRAVAEFFGLDAPEDAVKEGFQARVGQEVVAVYPIDASKMDLSLLRPAEAAASWAWRDVPDSMGQVVALGFPRNVPRLNAADAGGEAAAQYDVLADSVAAQASRLRTVPAHERAARAEELAQAIDDLRLLAADMGVTPTAVRRNAADAPAAGYVTARALIRQNDGTILTARQKDGRSLLPGGHLENGETPEAAVARELQEEMGLDISAALTKEAYDFHGEDGGRHRVFVVDGGKLDMSQLVPGDDVADAEFVNSPFTDSHGTVHPGETPAPDAAGADVAEIERHVAGIAHEVGELEKKNAGAHGNQHQYPDKMNGAFPVLICGATGQESIATQETAEGWRCEACGDVVAGPPQPETVVA